MDLFEEPFQKHISLSKLLQKSHELLTEREIPEQNSLEEMRHKSILLVTKVLRGLRRMLLLQNRRSLLIGFGLVGILSEAGAIKDVVCNSMSQRHMENANIQIAAQLVARLQSRSEIGAGLQDSYHVVQPLRW